MKRRLTYMQVVDKVYEINSKWGDDELQHSLEDDLYTLVLLEVAKQKTRVGMLAKEALRTKKLTFSRHCA